ncbi:MAG: exodeoxyribonuclease V subunit gamma [Nannocystaceae bacterium]|nr:exodeoxyribonuclease V subunit gamma [Nannocystaceae bacterium]
MALHLHRSNRIDALAQVLGDIVEAAPLPPLQAELVVVHGRQVATWLSSRLAERFGIWAHARFPFPRRFVLQVMAAIAGPRAESLALDEREVLQWLLLPAMERRLGEAAFAELSRYWRDDTSGVARFQLAARTAALFDAYLVHRPQMVLQWEQGHDEGWQAELWRELQRAAPRDHFARLQQVCVAALRSAERPPLGLPTRVALFGVASLPPSYLELVSALARTVDVHLLVPSPSRAFWAELRSRRGTRDPERAASFDEGHPLLASLGTLARDFQGLLEAAGPYLEHGELYLPAQGDSALAVLQGDLLDLRRREGGEGHEPPAPLRPDDDSIAVFSCHTRLREVEVLHDRLLDALARSPTLQPRDIVVYLTDVDAYAPLIEAVFERERDDPTALPFSITDRSARAESPTLEAWLRLLASCEGRMTASEVLDLLVLEPVAARFELSPDDLDTIADWIAAAGIRWGIDRQHRQQHGQPARDETTWAFGLRRMVLGYAMPGHGRESFAGVLPFDEIEGSRAELLGRLGRATELLFTLSRSLAAPRAVATWQVDLAAAIDAMLAPRPSAQWELDDLRQALARVAESAAKAGFDGEVPLRVMRDAVLAQIEGDRQANAIRGNRSGGVSFCALAPMRVVPAELVCVLGLSDGVFPRAGASVDFDLMRRAPAPGDRDSRDDDRYAFLEAIMAARSRLLLGYVGCSSQDDRDRPPSVVLAELLDLLGTTMVVPGTEALGPVARAAAVRRRVVTRVPMQPFSPRNFGGDEDARLFSFERLWFAGARALQAERAAAPPGLFAAPLPAPEPSPVLRLERLVRMFQSPQHELLRRRLQVDLYEWQRSRSDREPMELDSLELWRLGHELLRHRLEELPLERSHALLSEAGVLPLGAVGRAQLDALMLDVEPIAQALLAERGGAPVTTRAVEVDLPLAGLRLQGHLRHHDGTGLRIPHFSQPSARHQIELWILHLVACALAPGRPVTSMLAGRGDKGGARTVRFDTVAEPLPLLEELATLHAIGMCEPLPFFPKASLLFVEAFARKPADGWMPALEAARASFFDRRLGEANDAAVSRIYGGADPLARGFSPLSQPLAGGDFMEVAVRVLQPLLRHRRDA